MPERAPMFGIEKDELLAGLERIRERLCCYVGDRCDCKYGATGVGEQTGCPELREAMVLVAEEFDKLTLTKEMFEVTANKTLAEVMRTIDRYWKEGAE